MHIVFRVHALQRMFERKITEKNVRDVLEKGKVINEYFDDKPFPSKLILGMINKRPLHVVIADNSEMNEQIVITAYEPNPEQWEDNFEEKRIV